MDSIEDDFFQMDSFYSSDNSLEHYSPKKVQESFRKTYARTSQLLLTAVLTRTLQATTPQITITWDFRYCILPEYSKHSLSRNWNNRIFGLVELILKSQLCPFFISYKYICLSRTWKNCNSQYVKFFSAKVLLLTSKFTCPVH